MKTKQKKENKQIVEVHIYVHTIGTTTFQPQPNYSPTNPYNPNNSPIYC
jgi:hypothetical protein